MSQSSISAMDSNPTVLCLEGDRFILSTSGNSSVVRFMFDIYVIELPRDNLISGFLAWDGNILHFHSEDGNDNTVKGIEVDSNSTDITIWTTCAKFGNYSLITMLQDVTKQPLHTVFKPDPSNIVTFCKSIRREFLGLPESRLAQQIFSPTDSSHLHSPQPSSSNVRSTTTPITPSQSALPIANGSSSVVTPDTPTSSSTVDKKRKRIKKSKVKVIEKSADEIQLERLEMLSNKMEQEDQKFKHKGVEKVDVSKLKHDSTIRGIRMDFVQRLVLQMEQSLWIHDSVVLTVNKVGEDLFVIDGNHRLEALLKFLAGKHRHPYQKVCCRVYNNLTLDQIFLVCKPSYTVHPKLQLTELQMLKISVDYINHHAIQIHKNKTVFVNKFTQLMKQVIGENYLKFVTNLVCLHPHIHRALLEQQYNGKLLSTFSFPTSFWKTFMKAVSNDSNESLQILKSFENNSVEDVEKRLKNVQLNLLAFMSKFGEVKQFKNDTEAAVFFTGNDKTASSTVKQLLIHSKAVYNTKRNSGPISWSNIKEKLANWMSKKSSLNNVHYSGITVENFKEFDFILLIDPTDSVLPDLIEASESSVIVLVSTDSSVEPLIPDIEPTISLKVVLNKPVLIDSQLNLLPKVYAEASLYVPHVPKEEDTDQFLLRMAVEKNCKYASILEFDELHIFGKYSTDYNHALVAFYSKTSTVILKELSSFDKISILGNKSVQNEIEKLVATSKKESAAIAKNSVETESEEEESPVDES